MSAKSIHTLQFLELLPIWNSVLPFFRKEHLVLSVGVGSQAYKTFFPRSSLRSFGILLS